LCGLALNFTSTHQTENLLGFSEVGENKQLLIAIVCALHEQSNNIQHRKPPLGIFFIPNSAYFSVVKETNGYFCVTHNEFSSILL